MLRIICRKFFVRAIEFHGGIVASPSCTFNYNCTLIAFLSYLLSSLPLKILIVCFLSNSILDITPVKIPNVMPCKSATQQCSL